MKILPGNDSRHYIVQDPVVSPELLLGCTRRKAKGEYLVEANYLNMHQLGIPFIASNEDFQLRYDHPQLFNYQVKDVTRMMQQKHIMNANKMGYGKTVETVCALREIGVRNALIIAPKAVLCQWEKELRTWWPTAPTAVVHPTSSNMFDKHDIVITNYEAVQTKDVYEGLKRWSWDAIVLDESHKIKNRKSKRWNALVTLPAIHKMCLTGTPILRRVDDLWAQLFFLNWRFSGLSYWNFVNFFCTVKQGPFGAEPIRLTDDEEKLRLLNWLVELTCIRNPDMQLTQGHIEHVVDLKLEGAQKELYKATRDLLWETIPEELTITTGMTHLLRLRQITSNPEMFQTNCNNIKFDWIQEAIESNPDTKFVVYSNWSTPLVNLQRKLGNKVCVSYMGSNDDHTNYTNKTKFIMDPNTRVLVGTIGAMGTGVDGLQHACHNVVFLDKDWSPEINAQAIGRLDRNGQQHLVHAYYLECVGTVDRRVSRINLSKAEDIREALSDEP